MSREVVLAARPVGEPAESDFELRQGPDAVPGDGEVAIRNVFVSVDPYMRGRMTGVRTYVPPFEVGQVVDGAAVGRVTISRDERFAEGDWVQSMLGWREEGVAAANGLRKLEPSLAPPSTALGVLGAPGLTAWVGLVDIARVEPGETVYVSGAAGAVGSAAAQIAKLKGCRVIGSAGSPEKVAWLEGLGVEAFDYRTASPREALADGIDVFFDNVGGRQLEGALSALRDFGRVVACGAIAGYNDTEPQPGPRNLAYVVSKRLRIEGFIILDHLDRFPAFVAEVGPWVREGKLQYRETVLDGIDAIPRAFVGLFHGANIGKMLVRVGPDDPGR
jgi:NADPH-dependent curcumin reductase CurA